MNISIRYDNATVNSSDNDDDDVQPQAPSPQRRPRGRRVPRRHGIRL